MKKIFVYLVAATLAFGSTTYAQDGTVKKTGRTIKKGAKKVGKKTAEIGSKGVAKIQDRTYDGKVAPNGRTVYITEDSRYYWVNNKGKRIFVTEDQLKDKPND